MTVTYGQSALPSSVISVTETSTTAVSLAFDNSLAIVGGYDASAGSISASDENTAIEVQDPEEAATKFGDGSELHEQTQLAFRHRAGRVVCVPVAESSVTESVTSSSSITLSNAALDPRFNPEESVTGTDTVDATDLTVNLVDGAPSTPSNSNTLNLNPQTGVGEFDTSSDYDVTYTKGDFAGALDTAASEDVRAVAVCSADEDVLADALSEVNDRAEEFDFKRVVGNVKTAVTPSSYSVPFTDQRMVLTAPAYGNRNGQRVWLSVAVAARLAASPLGTGITGDAIETVTPLEQQFTVNETLEFGSSSSELEQVTVVRDGLDGVDIVEGKTTATGSKFDDIYRVEIIDDIAYSLSRVSDTFINSNTPNTPDGRRLGLEAPMRTVLRGAADETLLASTDGSRPFAVTSAAGDTDETATVDVAIDVVGLTKNVDLDLSVGAINTYGGAS